MTTAARTDGGAPSERHSTDGRKAAGCVAGRREGDGPWPAPPAQPDHHDDEAGEHRERGRDEPAEHDPLRGPLQLDGERDRLRPAAASRWRTRR